MLFISFLSAHAEGTGAHKMKISNKRESAVLTRRNRREPLAGPTLPTSEPRPCRLQADPVKQIKTYFG